VDSYKYAEEIIIAGLIDPDLGVALREEVVRDNFHNAQNALIFDMIQASDEPNFSSIILDLNERAPSLLTPFMDIISNTIVLGGEARKALGQLQKRSYVSHLRVNVDEIKDLMDNHNLAPERLQGMVEDIIMEASSKHDIEAPFSSAKDGITAVGEAVLQEGTEGIRGLRSGYGQLDSAMGGLREGNLCIIAARPGVGKTTLALNIAHNLMKAGKNTLIFSYEMGKEELQERLFMLNQEFRHKFRWTIDAADKVKSNEGEIFIADNARIDEMRMRGLSRLCRAKHGLDLIIVDYIQLMHSSKHMEGRQQEVSYISGQLKALAREIGVPIIALSQFNRKAADGTDIPKLHQLRDSGSLEQDADKVLLMYEDGGDEIVRRIKVHLAKNRQGPRALITMEFCPELASFIEADGDKYNDDEEL